MLFALELFGLHLIRCVFVVTWSYEVTLCVQSRQVYSKNWADKPKWEKKWIQMGSLGTVSLRMTSVH